MLPEKFIFLGLAISLLGQIFYLKEMVFGSTRPNLVSHFIWMLAPFIGSFFQFKAGAGLPALAVFMTGFASFSVILLSIFYKKYYWKLNNFDLICGMFSLFSLILYAITHNLGISIFFAIFSDSLAYIPTIKKSWNFPTSENASIYLGGIFSQGIALFIVKFWTFPVYAFSTSILTLNSVIIFCIFRKKIFKNHTKVLD